VLYIRIFQVIFGSELNLYLGMEQLTGVAKKYLSDITGKKPAISFDDVVKESGLKSLLPETVQTYLDEIDKATEDALHKYQCQLDNAGKTAQDNKCKTGKYLSQERKRLANNTITGYITFDDGKTVLFYGDGKSQVKLPDKRGNKNHDRGLANVLVNRSPKPLRKTTFTTHKVKDDRRSDLNDKAFKEAVEGEDGKSELARRLTTIGQRGIFFDEHGRPIKGTNNLRDRDEAIALSSRLPTEKVNDGRIPDRIKAGSDRSTTRHSGNKHGVGNTSDVLGGVAALGGITAIVGIVACLAPLHFVTSAITFLTSITTLFTNVNNAANAVFTVADGVFAIFNKKDATKPIKVLIQNAIDNSFGKENVQEAKNKFGSLINSIAVSTKLLEKIQQGRASTNNKVDQVAFSLGTVNNSLKDSGLIPADSPYMRQSESIDEFVDARAKVEGNEGLKENITTLTEELKTHEESDKAILQEKIAAQKVRDKQSKDINDVKNLLDDTKTNVDAVKAENL
jgi:ribosomal protein S17E